MLAIVHKNLLAKICFFCNFLDKFEALGKLATSRFSYLKSLINCCCLQKSTFILHAFQCSTKKMNRFAHCNISSIFEKYLIVWNSILSHPPRSVHRQSSSTISRTQVWIKSKWRSKVISMKGENLSLPTTNDRECKTPSVSHKQEYQN